VFPSVACGGGGAAQISSSLKAVLEQRNPKTSVSVSAGCGSVTLEFKVSGLTLDDATTFVSNAKSNNVTALVGRSFEQRYGAIRVGAVHIITTGDNDQQNRSAGGAARELGSLFGIAVGTIAGVCIFLVMLRHMLSGDKNDNAKGHEVPHVELQNMEGDNDNDDEEDPSIDNGGVGQVFTPSALDSNLLTETKANAATTANLQSTGEWGEQARYHHQVNAVAIGSDDEVDEDDVLTVGFREAGDS